MTTDEKKRRPRDRNTGSIYRMKGSRNWWIGYSAGGKRHFESSHSPKKGDATDLLNLRLGKIAEGVPVSPRLLGKQPLSEALDLVVKDQENNERRAIADTRIRIRRHLLEFFAPTRPIGSITGAEIEQYKSHRLGQDAKPATVNRELAILRRCFRLAVRFGTLLYVPHISMLAENNVRKGFFERAELDAVKKHLPSALHPALEFMFITGWRRNEVFGLRASQVDLATRTVRLEVGMTKSRQGRTFVMTASLYALLKTQLESIEALKARDIVTPFLFHWESGHRIRDFRKQWQGACVKAGYPGRLIHDFRRSAVRNLQRAGVSQPVAMAMVGHRTVSIYRRYSIIDETMLAEGTAKLEQWIEAQTAKKPSSGQVLAFEKKA